MRIQTLLLPHVVLGEATTQPFALIVDQYDGPTDPDTVALWARFRDECGAQALAFHPGTVEVVDRYAQSADIGDAAKAADQAERIPSELQERPEPASLPPEVIALQHAVDRMRDQWAETDVHVRYELWMAVHDASDAVYKAYRESPSTATLTAGWPRVQRDRSEDDL